MKLEYMSLIGLQAAQFIRASSCMLIMQPTKKQYTIIYAIAWSNVCEKVE